MAVVLGVTAGTIQNRDGGNHLFSAAAFVNLTGIALDTITTWHAQGLLPAATPNDHDETSYPTSDLIAALIQATLNRLAATNGDARRPTNETSGTDAPPREPPDRERLEEAVAHTGSPGLVRGMTPARLVDERRRLRLGITAPSPAPRAAV